VEEVDVSVFKRPYMIRIVHGDDCQELFCQAQSLTDRTIWIQKIRETVDRLNGNSNQTSAGHRGAKDPLPSIRIPETATNAASKPAILSSQLPPLPTSPTSSTPLASSTHAAAAQPNPVFSSSQPMASPLAPLPAAAFEAKALFAYHALETHDLSLEKDEIVTVVEMTEVSPRASHPCARRKAQPLTRTPTPPSRL
jgi:hypothetical protein